MNVFVICVDVDLEFNGFYDCLFWGLGAILNPSVENRHS